MSNGTVVSSSAIRHILKDKDPTSQKRGIHEVGLGLPHSAVRAMGWSFLASMFGPIASGMNDNVVEALKFLTLGSIVEVGRRFCNWALERFRFSEDSNYPPCRIEVIDC